MLLKYKGPNIERKLESFPGIDFELIEQCQATGDYIYLIDLKDASRFMALKYNINYSIHSCDFSLEKMS